MCKNITCCKKKTIKRSYISDALVILRLVQQGILQRSSVQDQQFKTSMPLFDNSSVKKIPKANKELNNREKVLW